MNNKLKIIERDSQHEHEYYKKSFNNRLLK